MLKHRSLYLALLAMLMIVASACGDDAPPGAVSQTEIPDAGGDEDAPEEDAEPDVEDEEPQFDEPDMEELPDVPVGVETLLTLSEVAAGTPIEVNCRIFNEAGTTVVLEETPNPQISISPAVALERGDEGPGQFIPVRAGTAVVTCSYPSLGLVDPTPETLTISPGPVDQVITELDQNVIRAGRTAQVTCSAFDAYGNPVPDAAPRILFEPVVDGVSVEENQVVLAETTGIYTVSCQVDGAEEVIPDTLEVIPNRATSLVISKIPQQDTYGLGQVVSIDSLVTDRFGNAIPDAVVEVASSPQAVTFGQARFRFDEEGVYTLDAEVTSDTENGLPVTAQTQVVVNGAGPSILCNNPADGSMLNIAPGSEITFEVSTNDVNGVESVRINDQTVVPNGEGIARATIETRYGINFVDVVATDIYGEQNSRTCAFLSSNRWVTENSFLDNNVALRLNQAAIDDGSRGGAINSLADLLHTVLNSAGLVSTLDSSLRSASPFINRCVQNSFLGCLYRLRVDYNSISVGGANEASLSLVNNGLRAVATVRNVQLGIGIGGTISTSGTATLRSLTVDMTFDMTLVNNRPQINVRSINSVNVGSIDTNFRGLAGFVINIIVDIFEGTVRNLLRDQLRNFISDSFDEILDGVVSGLDISSLGTSFNVPRLDGSGNIPVGLGLRFSSLSTNTARALFGLGLRFTGPVNVPGPTLGAPYPQGNVLLDPSTNRSVAASVHVAIINQVLHALWRGGLFNANIGGDTLGAPDDISAVIQTSLPPVLELQDGGAVNAMLGGMRVELTYPGLFDTPLVLYVGARASSSVELVNGDELRFNAIQIEELIFSTEDINLDPTTRAILEDFLRRLVQTIVDDALNNSLPALPIPSFALPDSLNTFGIPRGTDLGLLNPGLSNSNTHFKLEGNFGSR